MKCARLQRRVSAFLLDDKETECVFKRGRVTVMVPAPMHETLLACYHAIFGISDIRPEYLQELNKWSAFERAHLTQDMEVGRHDFYPWKPIRTLFDFDAEYEYVLAAFQLYNFLEQYGIMFGHTREFQREHVNPGNAIMALERLARKIQSDGFEIVSAKINDFITRHGTPSRELDNAILRWLYDQPDRHPVDRTSFMNTNPHYEPFERAPRDGKENIPPEARLPALLQKLEVLG